MTIVATLCYLLRGGNVLLIKKKRGFGAGKYNGVGGKVERGETIEEAAKREIMEEVGVEALELEYAGVLEFYSTNREPDWIVHVYRCTKFRGEPKASDEGKPRWFSLDSIPYSEMWEDDKLWLEHVLRGGHVKGRFWFNSDYSRLLEWELDLGSE